MKNIENLLKSNWAENYVAEWLSKCGSLVRTATQGRDVGIDLYCETTHNNAPFLHFWCQVKTDKDISIDNDSNTKYLKIQDVGYCLKQPIPVFIFYVPPRKKYRDTRVPLFICTLLEDLEVKKTVRVESSIKIEKDEDLEKFLNETIRYETFKWELIKGKVTPLPIPEPKDMAYFPAGCTQKYEEPIKNNICRALWRLSEDILREHFDLETLELKKNSKISGKEAIEIFRPYVQSLKKLVKGKKIPQCEYCVTIGILAELEEDYNKAEEEYKEAIKRIDDWLKSKPFQENEKKDWEEKKSKYNEYLKRVQNKIAQRK